VAEAVGGGSLHILYLVISFKITRDDWSRSTLLGLYLFLSVLHIMVERLINNTSNTKAQQRKKVT